MTKTTKEQRAAASLYIEKHTALQTTFPAEFVLALLSDSERLAAIEAVTGEGVQELVANVEPHFSAVDTTECSRSAGTLRKMCTALLSLSAKVAEQAEEIERLRGLHQGPHKLGRLADERRLAVEEATRLRRLLIETAVPALERIEQRDFLMSDLKSVTTPERVASSALSTIRAQIGDSPAAPRPARCPTCDDTRIIYGHGSFETSCPACHDADAEAGLAMLGGDGRG